MKQPSREELLTPGTVVSHFKREMTDSPDPFQYLYEIVGECTHSETEEKLVVYRALYGSKGLYCRPREMFLSPVDREKYPDVKQEWRFAWYCASVDQIR